MRKMTGTAAFVVTLLGCGSTGIPTVEVAPVSAAEERLAMADRLPGAPWDQGSLEAYEAPAPLLRAWRRAENRDWCAPMALTDFGGASEASARGVGQSGGWVLEYDQPGAPGIEDDGRFCERCGRGVFGIAGTPMSPAQVADNPLAEAPAPTFRDGSSAHYVSETSGPAAVTITVPGQGCVYQVWSLHGESHLRSLVESLRLVEIQDSVAMSLFR